MGAYLPLTPSRLHHSPGAIGAGFIGSCQTWSGQRLYVYLCLYLYLYMSI